MKKAMKKKGPAPKESGGKKADEALSPTPSGASSNAGPPAPPTPPVNIQRKSMANVPPPPPPPAAMTEAVPLLSNVDVAPSSKQKANVKMKKKKMAMPMNIDKFAESLEATQTLKTQYESEGTKKEEDGGNRNDLLQEIRSFKKSVLNGPRRKVNASDDGDEAVLVKTHKKVTVTPKHLCLSTWDGKSYPVHKLKFIVLQIPARDDVTLDFTCLAQITDLTFAIWADLKDKEAVRFAAVERIILDGCFQITDAGLGWIAKTFPNLQWMSLIGCSKITDLGLVTLARQCSKLVSLDLSSTGVHFLPSVWQNPDGMRMTGSSILFPVAPADTKTASKAKSPPDPMKGPKQNLFKVCILTREKASLSLLAAMKKEKQNLKTILPRIEPDVTINSDLTATVVEGNQSLLSSVVTNRSVIVLTHELKDKANILDEAESIRAQIIEILGKYPKAKFLIVGCSDNSAGIVPTDFIKEAVEQSLAKIGQNIKETSHSLSSIESMPVSKQLEYSAAQTLQESLTGLKLKSLEVNVEQTKDVDTLIEEIAKCAESMDILGQITYTKQIHDWAKNFHSKCPAALATGIHTLHQSAELVKKNSPFTQRLRSFGCIHFLTSIGKLSMWERDGQTMVANSVWLFKVLSLLLSPCSDGTTNLGRNFVIEDSVPVWTTEALKQEATGKKLDWNQVEAVIEKFPCVWLRSQETITTLSALPETPAMDVSLFTQFDKKAVTTLHIGFVFALNHNVPTDVLERIIYSVMALHRPIHVWKRGVIVYDSVLAVMVGQRVFGKLLNVCAYMTPGSHGGSGKADEFKDAANFMWSGFLKFRSVVVHELMRAGLVFDELRSLSDVLHPVPDSTGSMNSHSNNGEKSPCMYCGEDPQILSKIADVGRSVEPRFFNQDHIMSEELKGFVDGGLLRLEGPSEVKIQAALDPTGCQTCSVLLMHDDVKSLVVSVNSPDKSSLSLQLNNKGIVSTVKGTPAKTVTIPDDELSLTMQGVRVTFKIEKLEPFTLGLYLGPKLMHTVELPYNRYVLFIKSASLAASVTVIDSDFQIPVPNLKVGMRLEALDKLNPNLICVATIADITPNQEILIHFDGWTQRYDYWTTMSDPALHPIGYMAERGQQLAAKGRSNPALQIPNRYGKAFEWLSYLKEVKAEPVPYHMFSQEQTDGVSDQETVRLQEALNVMPSGSNSDKSQACFQNPKNPTSFDFKVKKVVSKISQALNEGGLDGIFQDDNPNCFCFLPANMSIMSLRYPSLAEVLSNSNQILHCICPGQALDLHFVNHSGLALTESQVGDLSSWPFLLAMYAALMNQKKTLPGTLTEFCKGSDAVPVEKHVEIERAILRLFHFYFTHILLLCPDALDPKSLLPKGLTQTQEATIQQVVKSGDASFQQVLSSTSSASQHLMCQAHRLANSPSKNIESIAVDMFQGLAGNIYLLDLQNNPLTSLPAELFSHFTSLTHLLLDGCNINELPSFNKNTCMEKISVRNNKLTSLPEDMKQLTCLKILNISNNPLGSLPLVVSKLIGLTELYADNIGTVDLAPLAKSLVNLTKLSISINFIKAVPKELGNLPLTSLEMAGLPKLWSASSLTLQGVKNFMEKYAVYRTLQDKDIQQLLAEVESLGDQSTACDKKTIFNKALSERFPRLGSTGSRDVPEAIFLLTKLVKLDISNQAFTTVPDDVKSLGLLEHLNVSNNHSLESVSAELARLPLKDLNLRDCPFLKTPPKEVVRRGFLAVFGYLKRLLQGFVSCRRTKLMMVGLGGAGKTSLVRALTNKKVNFYQDYGEQITDGIDITEWELSGKDIKQFGVKPTDDDKDDKQPLHFSVWDFAGQTVYYNTHQFFLSNRAVYLLVWNIRLGFEHAGLDFWLSSIACHAPRAPILVVGTHCDKVEKAKLPVEELRRRFPQIVGLHSVSSYSGEGINELQKQIIESALAQSYMGEKVPEAWLSLESHLDSVRKNEELLPWSKLEEVAATAGIFDPLELTEAVQFLHDLGSLQFFNTPFLRSHVVIVPQWIVDVMACVVTVHEGPIKNGKLQHSELQTVWSKYPAELHTWLLRLTEEFDLTFPLLSEEANIVPCLLPTTEPKYDFAPVNKEKDERESKMIYKFEYLPAGLFNRTQVRLHQFSDSSVMWKKGFMLKKNNHRALLRQVSNTDVVVTARGFKPENTLFLVHEVFETLIADSYNGVSCDFSIPCPDCVYEAVIDPCMIPASKIRRALDVKAPFLQCDKNFHIISIPEMQASLPPHSGSEIDDHLGRSVRELKDLGENGGAGPRCLFIYSKRNVPDLAREGKEVDPTQILSDLREAGMNVSFCDDPETANMESLTLAVKQAQVVLIGMSNEYAESTACKNLLIYIKQTLIKTIVLLAIGKTLDWQKTDINLVCSSEVFVKMTQIERYNNKIDELKETIKSKCQKRVVEAYPECFISYCWANSQTAVDLGSATKAGAIGWGDPRKIKEFLQSKGVNCWLDVEQMGQEGFYEDLADGLRKAKVMVAFVSDEYANSKNCKMEFRFALSTLKIPTVLAVVGTGYAWERSETGLLAAGHNQTCPKVNLQYENEAGLLDLLKEVQNFLPKDKADSEKIISPATQQAIAFQEVLELTQRKLLRYIDLHTETMNMESYPRLVLVDFTENGTRRTEKRTLKSAKARNRDSKEKQAENEGERKPGEVERKPGEEEDVKNDNEDNLEEEEEEKSEKHCLRLLCEFEQGWHESPHSVSMPLMEGVELEEFLKRVAAYQARVLAILKHTSLNLPILKTPAGEQLRRNLEEWCSQTSSLFEADYEQLMQLALDRDKNRTYGGLKRCHMPNGKILWLCSQHESCSLTQTEEKFKHQLKPITAKDKEKPKPLERQFSIASSFSMNSAESDLDEAQYEFDAASSTKAYTPVDPEDAKSTDTPQKKVKVTQPPSGGNALPRRPNLTRRNTSGRKTTSQACLLM